MPPINVTITNWFAVKSSSFRSFIHQAYWNKSPQTNIRCPVDQKRILISFIHNTSVWQMVVWCGSISISLDSIAKNSSNWIRSRSDIWSTSRQTSAIFTIKIVRISTTRTFYWFIIFIYNVTKQCQKTVDIVQFAQLSTKRTIWAVWLNVGSRVIILKCCPCKWYIELINKINKDI